jgi:hypothetical protein
MEEELAREVDFCCTKCGTKSAVLYPPFEKDLLTRFHSELVSYIFYNTRGM